MFNMGKAIRRLARCRLDHWKKHSFMRDNDDLSDPFKEKCASDAEEKELMKIIAAVKALQATMFEPKALAEKESA